MTSDPVYTAEPGLLWCSGTDFYEEELTPLNILGVNVTVFAADRETVVLATSSMVWMEARSRWELPWETDAVAGTHWIQFDAIGMDGKSTPKFMRLRVANRPIRSTP